MLHLTLHITQITSHSLTQVIHVTHHVYADSIVFYCAFVQSIIKPTACISHMPHVEYAMLVLITHELLNATSSATLTLLFVFHVNSRHITSYLIKLLAIVSSGCSGVANLLHVNVLI